MPADHDVGIDPLECCLPPLLRADARQQLVVAARRRVTEQDAPEPVHVDRFGQGQAVEKSELLLAQPATYPVDHPRRGATLSSLWL